MFKKHRKILIWSLFEAIIMFLALIDLKDIMPEKWASLDNVRHIGAFAVMIILSRITFSSWSIFEIVIVALIFGVSIEIAQEIFTNGHRKFYWMDLVNNVIGISLGTLILILHQILNRLFHKKLKYTEQ